MLISAGCNIIDNTIETKFSKIPTSIFTGDIKTTLNEINKIIIDKGFNDNVEYYLADIDKLLRYGLLKTKTTNVIQSAVEVDVINVYASLSTLIEDMEQNAVFDIVDLTKLNGITLPTAAYYEYDYKFILNADELINLLSSNGIITNFNEDYFVSYKSANLPHIEVTIPENSFTLNDDTSVYYIYDDINSLFSMLFSENIAIINTYSTNYIVNLKLQTSLNYEVIDAYPINSDDYVNSKTFYYSYFYNDKMYVETSTVAKTGNKIQLPISTCENTSVTHDCYVTMITKTKDIKKIAEFVHTHERNILDAIVKNKYPNVSTFGTYILKPICRVTISDLTVDAIRLSSAPRSTKTDAIIVSDYITMDKIVDTEFDDLITIW